MKSSISVDLNSYSFGFSTSVGSVLPLLLCLISRRLLLRFQRFFDVFGRLVGFPVGVYGYLCPVCFGRLYFVFQLIGIFKAPP